MRDEGQDLSDWFEVSCFYFGIVCELPSIFAGM